MSRLLTTFGITANIAGRKNELATEIRARSAYASQRWTPIRGGMAATRTARTTSETIRIFRLSSRSTIAPAQSPTSSPPTNIAETANETAAAQRDKEQSHRETANQWNRFPSTDTNCAHNKRA